MKTTYGDNSKIILVSEEDANDVSVSLDTQLSHLVKISNTVSSINFSNGDPNAGNVYLQVAMLGDRVV